MSLQTHGSNSQTGLPIVNRVWGTHLTTSKDKNAETFLVELRSDHRQRLHGFLLPLLWVLKSHIFSWPLVQCIIRMYLLMLAVICLECSGNWLPWVGGWVGWGRVHLPHRCLPKSHLVARQPLCGPQPPRQTQFVTTLWQITYTQSREQIVNHPPSYTIILPHPPAMGQRFFEWFSCGAYIERGSWTAGFCHRPPP